MLRPSGLSSSIKRCGQRYYCTVAGGDVVGNIFSVWRELKPTRTPSDYLGCLSTFTRARPCCFGKIVDSFCPLLRTGQLKAEWDSKQLSKVPRGSCGVQIYRKTKSYGPFFMLKRLVFQRAILELLRGSWTLVPWTGYCRRLRATRRSSEGVGNSERETGLHPLYWVPFEKREAIERAYYY